jgi:hypothetical protein
MIERLLALIDCIIGDLIDGNKRLCKKSRGHPSWGLCVATMLGKAIQSLSRLRIWPLPEAADVQMSVLDLAERLRSVDLTGYGGERHRCCQDDFLGRQIDEVLSEVPFFLDVAGARDHLKAQAKKSGVSHRLGWADIRQSSVGQLDMEQPEVEQPDNDLEDADARSASWW